MIDLPPRITDKAPLDDMLVEMSRQGGSDLFIMGGEKAYTKVLSKITPLTKRKISKTEALNILNDIYGINANSKLGSGEPIHSSHECKTEVDRKTKRLRFRVNAVNCQRKNENSITITFREIPTDPPHYTDLGISCDIVKLCKQLTQGLVMVCGGTSNGKSTTLASIIRELLEGEESNENVVTIEEPIEFVYDNIQKPSSIVTQMQVGTHISSFNAGIENSLRMAPTSIVVGEVKDSKAAKSALEGSLTGHKVLTTLHTNSVAETIQRFIAMFDESIQRQVLVDTAHALKIIVVQRLIPTIDGKRTAIREVLRFNKDIANKIVEAKNLNQTIFECLESSGTPMIVSAKEKLEEGIISESEYEKVKVNYMATKELSNEQS